MSDMRAFTQSDRYKKWECSGVDGLELCIKVQVNYQYNKEREELVNFQVFHADDKREVHNIADFLCAEDKEYIRTAIFDTLKDRGII